MAHTSAAYKKHALGIPKLHTKLAEGPGEAHRGDEEYLSLEKTGNSRHPGRGRRLRRSPSSCKKAVEAFVCRAVSCISRQQYHRGTLDSRSG